MYRTEVQKHHIRDIIEIIVYIGEDMAKLANYVEKLKARLNFNSIQLDMWQT